MAAEDEAEDDDDEESFGGDSDAGSAAGGDGDGGDGDGGTSTKERRGRPQEPRLEAHEPRGICADGAGCLYVSLLTLTSRPRAVFTCRGYTYPMICSASRVLALSARTGRLLSSLEVEGGVGRLSADGRQRVLVAQEDAGRVLEISLRLMRSTEGLEEEEEMSSEDEEES